MQLEVNHCISRIDRAEIQTLHVSENLFTSLVQNSLVKNLLIGLSFPLFFLFCFPRLILVVFDFHFHFGCRVWREPTNGYCSHHPIKKHDEALFLFQGYPFCHPFVAGNQNSFQYLKLRVSKSLRHTGVLKLSLKFLLQLTTHTFREGSRQII